jgi:O-antigen/teichoic acid export membrane protein
MSDRDHPEEISANLAQRSISSVLWNLVASLKIGVLVARSVFLARLLPVEVFGVYAMSSAVVALSSKVPLFGLADAFLHRASETEDEDRAAAVYFTLRSVFTLAWAAILVTGTLVFADGQTRTALLLLAATKAGVLLSEIPKAILRRRVVHRRLALLQFLDAVFSTPVALALAWRGYTIWALLSTDVVTLVLTVALLYVWRPVWRPRLAWVPSVVRYYLRFGSSSFAATLLMRALDRVDDLWTGIFLGETSLGFYSRAYTFATYPRTLLASPINAVATGTYAELKGKRVQLSKAFFRTNALLLRSGFLFGGALALVAPELIRLALGTKWMPTVNVFRTMLLFTLLDPIKLATVSLLVAVGKPEAVVRARGIQLALLLGGLLIIGPRWGIFGVALAVDGMVMAGLAILLTQARRYVDYSLPALFGPPLIALSAGLALGGTVTGVIPLLESDWWTGGVKLIVFVAAYIGIVLLLEPRRIRKMLTTAHSLYRARRSA